MKPLSAHAHHRRAFVVARAVEHLYAGRRLEVHGKAGAIFYLGFAPVDRPDPYWYEHSGGRTYKESPEDVVLALLPHVGFEAIEKAIVHAS